jgi:beta-aspartyl-peptidase (threonine type)
MSARSVEPTIVVHGGAGSWPAAGDVDVEDRRERGVAGCQRAAARGAEILAAGGSALDAVEAAVRVLEDDEAFNAGYGAVLTRDGTVEHDALVVDGLLRAGAVGALPGFAHPIAIARRLLEHGEHVFLVGEGAARFAREEGFVEAAPGALISPRAQARLAAMARSAPRVEAGDTVGACALDGHGRLAAATSTGGTIGKRSGRIGDSPILGAGAFADERLAAFSTTGHGESILRVGLARTAAERVRVGDELDAACRFALAELAERTAGGAGIIAVDPRGHFAHAIHAPAMPWAAVRGGRLESGIDP